jgi:hypothetical protein
VRLFSWRELRGGAGAFNTTPAGAAVHGPRPSHVEHPLDHQLRHETQHAEREHQEQHEGAEQPGLRLVGDLADDEQHVEHEGRQPEGQAEPRDLLLREAEEVAVDHGAPRTRAGSTSASSASV